MKFKNAAVTVSLVTAIVTAVLAAAKFTFGHIGHSHALIADGVHSLADILVDLLVLGAAHFGAQKADYNHPYGHGRIETAATFGLAQILIFAGFGIIADAGLRFWHHGIMLTPNFYVLWIAVAAIIVNEILFRWTLHVARRINSSLLEANAWHSRSDVAVSIVVLLSVGGALLGFPYLDTLGALIVGILIIKMGLTLAWRSICELVDMGVDENKLLQIRQIINAVPGVKTLHQLRTRTINKQILIDVHILVAPRLSVSEGHFIGEQVMAALQKAMTEVCDITVHVDPENDEMDHRSSILSPRDLLMSKLMQAWQGLAGLDQLQIIHLHYLAGKIEIAILLPHAQIVTNSRDQLIKDYRTRALQAVLEIQSVTIWFG